MNLPAVEASLRRVQREIARLKVDDRVVANMLAGYAFVDALAAEATDVFAMGNLKHLLELNTRVLCGTSRLRREAYRRHIEATAHRFYGEPDGGIQDVVESAEGLARQSVWLRAAGVYVRILSKPQLFIEGNHRTGALVMSYLLVRSGEPPFVLSVHNADAYFSLSTVIRETRKHSPTMWFRGSVARRRLAALLRAEADRHDLLA